MLIRLVIVCISTIMLSSSPARAIDRGETYDVLNLAALPTSRVSSSPLYGVSMAGERIVAVGERGLIAYSDDGAASWVQASVPVRSTLTDVFFLDDRLGWAAGHDGVILHTSDGGESWTLQLDGYQLIEIGLQHYAKLADSEPDNESYAMVLGEFEFAQEQGADKPFLKVYFIDKNRGFAFGAYGLSVATADGGENWLPIMEYGSQEFRHVFDFEIVGDRFYLTQEMGIILSGKIGERGSVSSIIPFYDGSFFTITSSEQGDLIVAGLRASAFRSDDAGQTWSLLDLPTNASINGSLRLADGRIALVSNSGELLLSEDRGITFSRQQVDGSFPLSGLVEMAPNELILGGPERRSTSFSLRIITKDYTVIQYVSQ